MKKIFSIIFVLSCAFAFASNNEPPVFEQIGEDECHAAVSFSKEFSFNDETNEPENEPKTFAHCGDDGDGECHDEDCDCCDVSDVNACRCRPRQCQPVDPSKRPTINIMPWNRYKVNFGMEKITMRFPHAPTISQTSTLLTALAYDHGITYSFSGYFPPMGNIAAMAWFDEILFSISQYPLTCLDHIVFQLDSGDWALDYVAHDYVRNLIIKTRAIVTPFNAYTIQCVKPNGSHDYFNYFIDSFWVKCECQD